MTSVSAPHTTRTYIRWALALLGALLITGLSTITTVDPVRAPPAPTDIDLTIGGISSIEQTFSITQPDLVGLAIQMRNAAQSDPNTRIPVRLRYADGPQFDLVIGDAFVRAAKDDMLTLRFPAITLIHDLRVPTTTLKLTLSIPALPPGTGPMITVRENALRQGEIAIDGRAEPSWDLVIVPIYERRWADRIWPISAMARGKPGLLGWPPLYPLLGYLYLLMLGAGIAALRQAQTTPPSDT
ncbi:hypothetical protein EKD04_024225 [Chloroflexales bacterium ZM16-3]|nr:hypothetical protein [Chloroflexales bacterium ZM16-3]